MFSSFLTNPKAWTLGYHKSVIQTKRQVVLMCFIYLFIFESQSKSYINSARSSELENLAGESRMQLLSIRTIQCLLLTTSLLTASTEVQNWCHTWWFQPIYPTVLAWISQWEWRGSLSCCVAKDILHFLWGPAMAITPKMLSLISLARKLLKNGNKIVFRWLQLWQ